jgi:hypothetical protein
MECWHQMRISGTIDIRTFPPSSTNRTILITGNTLISSISKLKLKPSSRGGSLTLMSRMSSREQECLTTPKSSRTEIYMGSLAGFPTSTSNAQKIMIVGIQPIENFSISHRIITQHSTIQQCPTLNFSDKTLQVIQ